MGISGSCESDKKPKIQNKQKREIQNNDSLSEKIIGFYLIGASRVGKSYIVNLLLNIKKGDEGLDESYFNKITLHGKILAQIAQISSNNLQKDLSLDDSIFIFVANSEDEKSIDFVNQRIENAKEKNFQLNIIINKTTDDDLAQNKDLVIQLQNCQSANNILILDYKKDEENKEKIQDFLVRLINQRKSNTNSSLYLNNTQTV